MDLEHLEREFFSRNTKLVAKDLLGNYMVRKTEDGNMIGKIIETEAYLGPKDKASHCYDYKKTEKTKVMYEKPGTLYVYYIYGMYFCLNVITEPEGMPCGVFIRELYPIRGIELMKANRSVKIGKDYKNLVDGPSKLCMAFDITKESFNGKDSCSPDAKLFFTKGEAVDKENITAYKRIGIEYAEEDKNKLLRFRINP
ncbi:MAG: DNA-3-methyladenine glycosylase [Candidatus Lokiarchaeota archaeon]|nr:DNA-3-methyladenine glycosylase [Candidatus Lokiarchaeota archaeon]MBD3339971.1 DNA-3-methyladenine glycosylase [Candidatus Lokiarchaeota archaeon]